MLPKERADAGLVANTEYEYEVLSADASGNGPTRSELATFTTQALPDATPPVILSGPEPSYLASDLVIIVWADKAGELACIEHTVRAPQ